MLAHAFNSSHALLGQAPLGILGLGFGRTVLYEVDFHDPTLKGHSNAMDRLVGTGHGFACSGSRIIQELWVEDIAGLGGR